MSEPVWVPDGVLEEKIDRWIQAHQEEFVRDLRELVAVPSVSGPREGDYPFGRECGRVLQLALEKAEQYGFQAENYENYCGGCRLKGEKTGEIGLFSHLDVVPLGDGWEYPPLGCTLKDGFLVGRGVGDNKGPAVAALYALRFLRENGIRLKHDVLLYFGCSEERGMEDIEHFTSTRPLPDFSLVPDTNFPVCYGEKGIFRATARKTVNGRLKSFQVGEVANVIPAYGEAVIQTGSAQEAKAICDRLNGIKGISGKCWGEGGTDVKVEAEGISRHAAFPDGSVNAVQVLAEALKTSGMLGGEEERAIAGIASLTASVHGETAGIPFEDEETGKLTCCGTVVRLEKGELTLSFDIRYPSSFCGEQVRSGLENAVGEFGFVLEDITDSGPFFISPDRPEIKTLCRVADHVLGRSYEPYTMGGGTYARHLPNAVGFGPGLPDQKNPFPPGRGQGHQPDECIELCQLIDGFKAYVLALLALDEIL